MASLLMISRRKQAQVRRALLSLGGEDGHSRAMKIQSEYQARISKGRDEWRERGLDDKDFSVILLEEIWEREKEARERQAILQSREEKLMAQEEELCRDFYLYELRGCLKERGFMWDEEQRMRSLMMREALKSVASKYSC